MSWPEYFAARLDPGPLDWLHWLLAGLCLALVIAREFERCDRRSAERWLSVVLQLRRGELGDDDELPGE